MKKDGEPESEANDKNIISIDRIGCAVCGILVLWIPVIVFATAISVRLSEFAWWIIYGN